MYNPWIEKYRPENLEDIILNDTNRTFFNNIIEKNYYPNMIFYGPPGTGKTTTILCLIKKYQEKNNCTNNYIHLNASHQRGIDIIRNKINNFTLNKNFFNDKKKFILLDEVDSMTKQAQQNLYYIIDNCKNNICFILICNYMNKIIDNIKNSLMIIHFNKITQYSDTFINKCIKNENIKIKKDEINKIKENNIHDLRSIINFLQTYNKDIIILDKTIINKIIYSKNPQKEILKLIKYYDDYDIICYFFFHIYLNYTIDYNIISMIKCILFINCNMEYFIKEFLPYFKKLNNID